MNGKDKQNSNQTWNMNTSPERRKASNNNVCFKITEIGSVISPESDGKPIKTSDPSIPFSWSEKLRINPKYLCDSWSLALQASTWASADKWSVRAQTSAFIVAAWKPNLHNWKRSAGWSKWILGKTWGFAIPDRNLQLLILFLEQIWTLSGWQICAFKKRIWLIDLTRAPIDQFWSHRSGKNTVQIRKLRRIHRCAWRFDPSCVGKIYLYHSGREKVTRVGSTDKNCQTNKHACCARKCQNYKKANS